MAQMKSLHREKWQIFPNSIIFFNVCLCIFIIVCQNNHSDGHSLNAERKQMKIGFIFVSKDNFESYVIFVC